VGVTTVTWTATDANGNSATATQLVTVNLIDTIAPVITVPANVAVTTSASQATVDIGMATATDNVDGIVAVTNDAPAAFPIGVTTVTWTASDAAGNTATATQNIYVSYSSTVGGGSGGTTTPPPAGGGATVTSEAVYWHHNDHLGTPQAMTDANGTKVWEMSQTPFGIATVNEDPDGDGVLVTNNFRFPGQYFDAETGVNYNYHRTYDPATGRYTQSDPIGLEGGMNTYAYVGGNPLSYADPEGLMAEALPVIGGTVFAVCRASPQACAAVAGTMWCAITGTCSAAWIDNPEAESEWKAYKEAYSAPIPDDPNDPCKKFEIKIEREKQLMMDRMKWDMRWYQGRHNNTYQQSLNTIRNLKKKLAKCRKEQQCEKK